MTPHFNVYDDPKLRCSCGCGGLPSLEFMQKVEALRVLYGKPMKVSSGYRCPEYNAKVSKTGSTGPHTTGRAIDIAIERGDAFELVALALSSSMFTGLGVQQKGQGRFIHLDDLPNGDGQPRPTIWSY